MKRRRGTDDVKKLARGPACFTQAFGITKKDNDTLVGETIEILDAPELAKELIGTSPRVGISKAADLPWRFFIKANPYVSKTS